MNKTLLLAAALTACLGLTVGNAFSDDASPQQFYKGKIIDLSISSRPGGSVDTFGRLLAPFLADYLDAKVEPNTRRKAGGVEGHNFVYQAKPDGLTIGVGTNPSILSNEFTNAPGVLYNSTKFGWIGSLCKNVYVFVAKKGGPYQSLEAFKAAKHLRLGATSMRGTFALGGATIIDLLGWDGKVIAGYKGLGNMLLAVLQGEVSGCLVPLANYIKNKDQLKPLLLMDTKSNPHVPGVPNLGDLVTPDGKYLATTWSHLYESKVIYTTPSIDAKKLQYLRDTWLKIAENKSDIAKLYSAVCQNVSNTYATGEEVQTLVNETMQDKDKLEKIFESLIEKYQG